MTKRNTINVQGTSVCILAQPGGDYISLTDMVRNFDGGSALIEQWLKNKVPTHKKIRPKRIKTPGSASANKAKKSGDKKK